MHWCEPNKVVYRWVNLKAIKRLVEADALKMEIIPNPKVCVLVLLIFLLSLLKYKHFLKWVLVELYEICFGIDTLVSDK